ncbi:hypothetical protein [Flindersiella endophytica]
MRAIHEQYTRELYKKWHYFATWAPNLRLALGDVGVLRGFRFDRWTSLADLGVDFATRAPGEPADYSHSSAGQVDVSLDGDVGAPALAGGGAQLKLTVSFKSAQATYFHAVRCTSEDVSDLPSLERALVELRRAGTWRQEYVVVTQLVRTGPAIILVSDRAGARAQVQVKADYAPVPVALGAASAALTASTASGMATSVISPDGGVTPLFRVAKLRRSLGGRRGLIVRGGRKARWRLGSASWEDFAEEA